MRRTNLTRVLVVIAVLAVSALAVTPVSAQSRRTRDFGVPTRFGVAPYQFSRQWIRFKPAWRRDYSFYPRYPIVYYNRGDRYYPVVYRRNPRAYYPVTFGPRP